MFRPPNVILRLKTAQTLLSWVCSPCTIMPTWLLWCQENPFQVPLLGKNSPSNPIVVRLARSARKDLCKIEKCLEKDGRAAHPCVMPGESSFFAGGTRQGLNNWQDAGSACCGRGQVRHSEGWRGYLAGRKKMEQMGKSIHQGSTFVASLSCTSTNLLPLFDGSWFVFASQGLMLNYQDGTSKVKGSCVSEEKAFLILTSLFEILYKWKRCRAFNLVSSWRYFSTSCFQMHISIAI